MKPSANGQPEFALSISSYIVAEMKVLAKQAASIGKKKEYLTAWLAIEKRLITDPLSFGECRYHTMNGEMEIRIGIIQPAVVEFVVHEAKRAVILRHVFLLGN